MADRQTDRRAEVERMNPLPSPSIPRHNKINHQSLATWSFERREKEQEEEKNVCVCVCVCMKGNQRTERYIRHIYTHITICVTKIDLLIFVK